ncbi:MAG: glycosyltransferase family 4 protein [Pyrinomonadaceae bacterium]
MKPKIVYVERKFWESVSLEKVFGQIEKNISKEKFETLFVQLPYLSTLTGIIKNFIFFKKPQADIYHITGHIHFIALILPKEKTVLTIPDLTILRTRKGLRQYLIKKLFFELPVRKLKYITAISEATKNEIIKYTNCEEGKIRVIEIPLSDDLYLEIGKTFNSECPTILQIGTARHKNIINLAKALKGINCRLRIIGKLDEELLNELKINQITFTNDFGLSDAEIRNEYEKADIVAFCSTSEGFGLPIIEAQAMRTPVITSNLDPMKEVAGGAAVLVEPNDVLSIREGVLKIINDEFLRNALIEKGLINIKRFEPVYVAGLYENLYREIIGNENIS